MNYSKVIGSGSYLPEKTLTNEELSTKLDTSDEWIVERTGIRSRHIAAEHETSSSMATLAAQDALKSANINALDLDMIIVGTSSSDKLFPSTACFIQEKLGAFNACAFDLSAACAGFNYGLSIADQFIKTGQAKRVLVIGVEIMSRLVDWTDRSTCILFGDGAGAMILEQSDEPGIISTHIHTDGRYTDMLSAENSIALDKNMIEPPKLRMKGNEVFKIAVTKLGQTVIETLKANNIPEESIDWLIPHQANLRIIKAVAKKLKLPLEKVILTIEEQGNTSAASVPLAFDTGVKDGRVKRGDLLLLESFGAGFTWGSALIRY